jgi:hypothetical protein
MQWLNKTVAYDTYLKKLLIPPNSKYIQGSVQAVKHIGGQTLFKTFIKL